MNKPTDKTYIINRDVNIIKRSGLFNIPYYKSQFHNSRDISDPIHHYVTVGHIKGKNPCPTFDTKYYIQNNTDIQKVSMHPFTHYIKYGKNEGRLGCDPKVDRLPTYNSVRSHPKQTQQTKQTNSINNKSKNTSTRVNTNRIVNVVKKDKTENILSKPLHVDNLCFIIVKYTKNPYLYNIYENCLRSIRMIYDRVKIVVLDDHSPEEFYSIPECFKNDENISLEKTIFMRAGEFNGYYHFHKNRYTDRAVIMHDSMFLKKPINNIENVTIKFLWHFDRPKKEKNYDYNALLGSLNDYRIKKDIIQSFANQQLSKWNGCFGVASVISLNYLTELQKKTGFLDIIHNVKCRRDRMAMERIFAIVNFIYGNHLRLDSCSLNGSIIQHPNKRYLHFKSDNNYFNLDEMLLLFRNYNSCMIKTWHGR